MAGVGNNLTTAPEMRANLLGDGGRGQRVAADDDMGGHANSFQGSWMSVQSGVPGRMADRPPLKERLAAGIGLAATVLLTIMMIAALLTPLFAAERVEGQAQVVDGDTPDVQGTRIRLFGFDAPEGKQTCRDAAGERYLCGSKAALALADWIGRRRVTCEERDRDRYGRVVASCSVGGEDVGAWMVSWAHAREYVEYSDGRYADEERAAREAKRGIWQGQHEAPWDWPQGAARRPPGGQPRGQAGRRLPDQGQHQLVRQHLPRAGLAPLRADAHR